MKLGHEKSAKKGKERKIYIYIIIYMVKRKNFVEFKKESFVDSKNFL